MKDEAALQILVLLGIPAVFGWTLLLLDWFGRRQQRRHRDHNRAA